MNKVSLLEFFLPSKLNISISVLPAIKQDSPSSWQYGFQDPASPVMEAIIDLHNDIMGVMMFILFFVVLQNMSVLHTSLYWKHSVCNTHPYWIHTYWWPA